MSRAQLSTAPVSAEVLLGISSTATWCSDLSLQQHKEQQLDRDNNTYAERTHLSVSTMNSSASSLAWRCSLAATLVQIAASWLMK